MGKFLPNISLPRLNSLLKKQLGFTLVELLIVIAIVGVLAGGILVLINPAKQIGKAKDAQRKAALNQIQTALKNYYITNGAYPTTSGWVYSTAGDNWIPGLVESREIESLPKDPKQGAACSGDPRTTGPCWAYGYWGGAWCFPAGQAFLLTAHLEGDTSTAQSQKPLYNTAGGLCSNWSEYPVAGFYVLSGGAN